MSVPNVAGTNRALVWEGWTGVARPWFPTGVAAPIDGAWSHRDLRLGASAGTPGTGVWSHLDLFGFVSIAWFSPGVVADSDDTSHLCFLFLPETTDTVSPASR